MLLHFTHVISDLRFVLLSFEINFARNWALMHFRKNGTCADAREILDAV